MIINLTNAIAQFEQYVSHFDQTDARIRLKKEHTYGVIEAAKYITYMKQSDSEERQLALLIALLHDIGRFEQIRLTNSFDDSIIDHAQLGVELLKKDQFIRKFIETSDYDQLIFTALLNHNTFEIDSTLTGQFLVQTQLIRDADKLDNYRVKQTEDFETLFGISKEELESQKITAKIYDTFMNHKLILHKDRQTHLDMWISYIAFMYDLYFPFSLQYIQEKNYLPAVFERLSLHNPNAQQQYDELYQEALKYTALQTKGLK